jgi:hypothetical protein
MKLLLDTHALLFVSEYPAKTLWESFPLVNSDLNNLLKAASRSFYLTLRALPAAVSTNGD